jgi:coenzyme PQQ precursor peptide PqqA
VLCYQPAFYSRASGCSAGLRRYPLRTNIAADNQTLGKPAMAWTTPILVEICIGLEINGYLPAEF